MNEIKCFNLGNAMFFGYLTMDEQCNMVPQLNGWKIEAIPNIDGGLSLVIKYYDEFGNWHDVHEYEPISPVIP